MSLQTPRGTLLREALSHRHDESFERALGRVVRKHGGTYEDYIALISDVRECGRSKDLDLRAAAKALANQP